MQTYTGKQFWPVDPRPEEIDIEDIAHALSLMCRYGGHCQKFYSVAEHSILVSEYLENAEMGIETALWGLLHDASEAYLVDIPRPIKSSLQNYYELETNLMKAICKKYNLPEKMPEYVKFVDNNILADERDQNLKGLSQISNIEWGAGGNGLGIRLRFLSPKKAEEAFLDRFEKLSNEIETI